MSPRPPIFGTAVRRLVWRDITSNKRRTAGVFLLTVIPLIFVYFLTTAISFENSESFLTGVPTVEEQFGQAEASFQSFGPDFDADQLPGDPRVVGWRTFFTEIGPVDVNVVDAPIEDPLLRGHQIQSTFGALLEGSFPTEMDEVAMSRLALDTFGDDMAIGDTLSWGDQELTVVGLLARPAEEDSSGEVSPFYGLEPVLFAPGQLDLGQTEGLLDWGAAGVPDDLGAAGITDLEDAYIVTREQREADFGLVTGSSIDAPDAALIGGVFMFGLSIVTGAVAFVAWRSSATRRLRDTGLLASSGATGGQLGSVQAAQGLLISLAAVIVALAAMGAVLVNSEFARDFFGRAPSTSLSLPVVSLILPTVVAISAATIAAWWPAHRAAKTPLAEVLEGRIDDSNNGPLNALAGVLLMIVGALLLGWSANSFEISANTQVLAGGAGLIALAIGALPIIRAVFQVAGHRKLVPHVPVTARLVLRSMARHAGRSAAAVLGIGAIVTAVWAGAIDLEQERSQTGGSSETVIEVSNGGLGFVVTSEGLTEPGFRGSAMTVEDMDSDVPIVAPADGIFVSVAHPDPLRRDQIAAEVVATAGDPESRVELDAVRVENGGRSFGLIPPDSIAPEVSVVFSSALAASAPLFDPQFDDTVEVGERVPALDTTLLVFDRDIPQAELDALLQDDRVLTAGVGRSLGIESGAGLTDLQIQAILLAIGVAVAAFVVAIVGHVVNEEVRDEMSLVALLGTDHGFTRRFLALNTFVISAVGVGAGLVVGTVIRVAVDEGIFISPLVLLALVLLPFVLSGATFLLARPQRPVNRPTGLALAG